MPTTLSMAMKGYKIAAKAENKSDRTIELYELAIKSLDECINDSDLDVATITRNHIRAWLTHLHDRPRWQNHPYAKPDQRGLSPHAISAYFRGARAVFSWLVSEEIIPKSPFDKVKAPEVPDKTIPTASREDVRKLLAVMDTKTPTGSRDYALFLTKLDCGARVSELIGLDLDDVDLESGMLHIRGKGKKERFAPIGVRASKALWRYITKYRPEPLNPNCRKVFLTHDGRPMRKEPVEVTKGEFTGIPYPADDEIVIEGEVIHPDVEQRDEGPFGEWTGYYGGGKQPQPVVRVKAVYHRNNPILASFPPLKPPIPRFGVPIVSAPAIWNDLDNAGIIGVKGVWQLYSGGGRLLTVISIKQEHAGHAKQAAMVAAGGHGGGYMGRYVIVVDDDIDPTNAEEVLWAIATRCEPEDSIDILRDCWGTPLDPLLFPEKRRNKDYSHSIAILNACRPFPWKDEFPEVNRASDELRSKVAKKWGKEIGL